MDFGKQKIALSVLGRWIHPHAANHAALHAYTLAYGLN